MRKTLSKLISNSSTNTNSNSNTSSDNNMKLASLVPNKLSKTSNMFLQSLNSVIDDFYIMLDSPHKVYKAGSDQICGLVVLIVKKPLNNIYITLSINGVVKANDIGLTGSEKVKLFSISVNLYGSQHENSGLSKGEHRFPFKIKLPRKNIYSSLSFEKGSISYSLKSELFLSQELSSINSAFSNTSSGTANNDLSSSSSSSSNTIAKTTSIKGGANNKAKSSKVPEKNNRLTKCEKNIKIICPINVERFKNNNPSVLIIKQPPKKSASASSTNVSFLSKKSSNSSSNNINNNVNTNQNSTTGSSNLFSSPQFGNNNSNNNNDDSFTVASSSSTTNSLTRTVSSSLDSNHSSDQNQQQASAIIKANLSSIQERKIKLTLDTPNIAYLPNDTIPFTVKLQHVNTIKSLDGMIITLIRVCKINSYDKQKKSRIRSFSSSATNNNNNNMTSSNSLSSIPGISTLHQKFRDSSVTSDSSLEEEEEEGSINEELQNGNNHSNNTTNPSSIPQSIPASSQQQQQQQLSHDSPVCSIRGKIATFRKDIDQVIKPLYVLSANQYTFEVSGNLKLPYDAFPTLRGAPLFSFEYFIEVVVNLNNSHQSLIGSSGNNLPNSPILDSDDITSLGKRRDKLFNIRRIGNNSSNNGNGMHSSSTNNSNDKNKSGNKLEGSSNKDDSNYINGKHSSFETRPIVNVDKLKTQKNVISLTRRIIIGTERNSLVSKKVTKNSMDNTDLDENEYSRRGSVSGTVEISYNERNSTVSNNMGNNMNIHPESSSNFELPLPAHPPPFPLISNHELPSLPPSIEEPYGTFNTNRETASFPPPPHSSIIAPAQVIGTSSLTFPIPVPSINSNYLSNNLSEKEILKLQEEALFPSEAPEIFASTSSTTTTDNSKDNTNNACEFLPGVLAPVVEVPSTVAMQSGINGVTISHSTSSGEQPSHRLQGETRVSSLSNDLATLVHSDVIDCVPKYEDNKSNDN